MSKKWFTPEQIIGKLREAQVALSASYLLLWVLPKRFDIQIISGIFGAPRISVDPGKIVRHKVA